MSKRFKNKTCVFCVDRPSDSADHLFSRALFPVELRGNLPKVPACSPCQGEKSDLEHYVSTVLPFGSNHPSGSAMLKDHVARRLAKNAPLQRRIRDGAKEIWVSDKKGVSHKSLVVPFEWEKYRDLLRLIVRGLVWTENQVVVPRDYQILVTSLTREGATVFFDNIVSLSPHNRRVRQLAGGAVRYTYTYSDDDHAMSAWMLDVYQVPKVMNKEKNLGPMEMFPCALCLPPSMSDLTRQFRELFDEMPA